MAKNDSILIDGIVSQRAHDGIPSGDKGEVFEYFCFEQLLKNFDLSKEEIEAGWVDGRHDGGIDGFYIFVNGHLIWDTSSFLWPRSNAKIEVFIISCKYHDTFKEATLNSILATTHELLDFSLLEDRLRGAYSKDILLARKRLIETYAKLAITTPELTFNFSYCSRGDVADLGESVAARAEQIRHCSEQFFSNATARFSFVGSAELIEQYRKGKQFTLDLPFQDHLAGTGEGYIVVAKLGDYHRFVCDESGSLRRYLFDSNVRDYLGENKVNEDIAGSLENESVPDFWWFNNGITILTTKAVINGKVMQMQDIQVVNGLQTTETIYRHFSTGSQKSLDRTLSIKIIVSKDDKLRDQIIRATNNQSVVEQAALHATDKIQRDIEQILERYDFYYERRKNYYRNIGRPPARFVTPLFLAGGYVSIALKNPATAATLKSRFMRSQSTYEQVFSDAAPIEVWPRIATVMKAVEEEMLSSLRKSGGHGEKFLKSWRGLVGLLVVAKQLGKFDFSLSDLSRLPANEVDRGLVKDCWEYVQAARKGQMRPSKQFVAEVCHDFARLHSLTGVDTVGRRYIATYEGSRTLAPNIEVPDALLEQVDSLMPPQPWRQGAHIEVAEKIGVPAKVVSAAIRLLIDRGRRMRQLNGELFNQDDERIFPPAVT